MCVQPIYENDIKSEFRKNIQCLEKAIEEANKVLRIKYKKRYAKSTRSK